MRQVLLMAIVGCIALGGIHTPVIGLFGYIWFALCRPDYLAFSRLPFSLMLAIATVASSFRHMSSLPRIISNPISAMLVLLQIPVALSVVFALDPSLSTGPYGLYLRVMVMALMIPLLVDSEVWLRRLFFVMVFSMGLAAVKMGLGAGLRGGRLNSGFYGFYADTNGLALAMAILIPLAIYARELTSNYLVKMATLFIAVCAIVTVASERAASRSRSARAWPSHGSRARQSAMTVRARSA